MRGMALSTTLVHAKKATEAATAEAVSAMNRIPATAKFWDLRNSSIVNRVPTKF